MSVPKRNLEILPDIEIGNKYNPLKSNYNKTQYFVVSQNVDLGKINFLYNKKKKKKIIKNRIKQPSRTNRQNGNKNFK